MLGRMIELHADAIRAAGGRTHVARTFGLAPDTVKDWPKRGIPARYWHHIVQMAADRLPGLSIEKLEQAKSPSAAEAAE
jgi:hypothetical protein